MMQDLKVQVLVMVLIFAISIASGDVSLQNSYYTTGSDSREQIYLHEMDYSNSASISSISYYASSQASPANQSKDSSFEDAAYMHSIDGAQGASLKIDAEDPEYSRSISGGESNSITFSYSNGPGIVQADYFTPSTKYSEDISLINSTYYADFGVYDSNSHSYGVGDSMGDNQSSFKQDIYMSFSDKFCSIKTVLNTGSKNYGAHPVNYTWDAFSGQKQYAYAGTNLQVFPGNRTVEFWIDGTSSILEDKFSPDKKNDTYPAKFNKDGYLVLKNNSLTRVSSKTILMQYRLNQTS